MFYVWSFDQILESGLRQELFSTPTLYGEQNIDYIVQKIEIMIKKNKKNFTIF